LRERRWSHLILALYRSGRRADAVGAYQRLRTILVEEVGIEPCLELQGLGQAVMEQHPELDRPWYAAARRPLLVATGTVRAE
jgi:DNA-binding SARP family transcriptional activator